MANFAALDLRQLAAGSINSTLTWSQYLTCLPSIGQLQPRPLHSVSPAWGVLVPRLGLQKHKSILPKGDVYKWMQSSSLSQPIAVSQERLPKNGEKLELIGAQSKPFPRTDFPVRDVSTTKNIANGTAASSKSTGQLVKCYTCEISVGKKHTLRHLLFGKAECVKCKMIFINCLQFQEATNTTLSHSCSHTLRYLYDPFSFLKTRISEEIKDSGPLRGKKLHKKLLSYIRKVLFLKTKNPWMHAIFDCLEKLEKGSDNKMPLVPPNKPCLSKNNVKKVNDMQRLSNVASDTQGPIVVGSDTRGPINIASDSPIKHISNSKTSAVSNTEEIETGEVLLTQSYDLEHLDEIVEYQVAQDYDSKAIDSTNQDVVTNITEKVNVAQDNRTLYGNEGEELGITTKAGPKNKKVKLKGTKNHTKNVEKLNVQKIRPSQNDPLQPKVKTKRKRTKAIKRIIETDPCEEEIHEEQEAKLEFVKTPEDGYYYVVRKAIEECPICYTALCPSRFTVNVVTFLITTVCEGCSLTIYIVYDPPDGRAPVSIVTEKTSLKARKK